MEEHRFKDINLGDYNIFVNENEERLYVVQGLNYYSDDPEIKLAEEKGIQIFSARINELYSPTEIYIHKKYIIDGVMNQLSTFGVNATYADLEYAYNTVFASQLEHVTQQFEMLDKVTGRERIEQQRHKKREEVLSTQLNKEPGDFDERRKQSSVFLTSEHSDSDEEMFSDEEPISTSDSDEGVAKKLYGGGLFDTLTGLVKLPPVLSSWFNMGWVRFIAVHSGAHEEAVNVTPSNTIIRVGVRTTLRVAEFAGDVALVCTIGSVLGIEGGIGIGTYYSLLASSMPLWIFCYAVPTALNAALDMRNIYKTQGPTAAKTIGFLYIATALFYTGFVQLAQPRLLAMASRPAFIDFMEQFREYAPNDPVIKEILPLFANYFKNIGNTIVQQQIHEQISSKLVNSHFFNAFINIRTAKLYEDEGAKKLIETYKIIDTQTQNGCLDKESIRKRAEMTYMDCWDQGGGQNCINIKNEALVELEKRQCRAGQTSLATIPIENQPEVGKEIARLGLGLSDAPISSDQLNQLTYFQKFLYYQFLANESSWLVFPVQIASMLMLAGTVSCAGFFLANWYRKIDVTCIKNPENSEMIRMNNRNTYNLIGLGVCIDPKMQVDVCANCNPFMKRLWKTNTKAFDEIKQRLTRFNNDNFPDLEANLTILDQFKNVVTDDQFDNLNPDDKLKLQGSQQYVLNYTQAIEQEQPIWMREIFIQNTPDEQKKAHIIENNALRIVNGVLENKRSITLLDDKWFMEVLPADNICVFKAITCSVDFLKSNLIKGHDNDEISAKTTVLIQEFRNYLQHLAKDEKNEYRGRSISNYIHNDTYENLNNNFCTGLNLDFILYVLSQYLKTSIKVYQIVPTEENNDLVIDTLELLTEFISDNPNNGIISIALNNILRETIINSNNCPLVSVLYERSSTDLRQIQIQNNIIPLKRKAGRGESVTKRTKKGGAAKPLSKSALKFKKELETVFDYDSEKAKNRVHTLVENQLSSLQNRQSSLLPKPAGQLETKSEKTNYQLETERLDRFLNQSRTKLKMTKNKQAATIRDSLQKSRKLKKQEDK